MDFQNHIDREAYRRFAAENGTSVRTAFFIGAVTGLWAVLIVLMALRIWGI